MNEKPLNIMGRMTAEPECNYANLLMEASNEIDRLRAVMRMILESEPNSIQGSRARRFAIEMLPAEEQPTER